MNWDSENKLDGELNEETAREEAHEEFINDLLDEEQDNDIMCTSDNIDF